MNGLVAAVVTPMDSQGGLNLSLVPAIVDHLERNGICGVYIAGSTGEGMSLTEEERQAVAEAYLEHCRGRMRTVVQVGHNSMRAAAALAAHAESCGADAISATPTGYFQAEGEEGLVEAMSVVTSAAAATPFYYYHIPALSGASMNPMRFTQLARERLPTFCGIKYTDAGSSYNLPSLQKAGPGLEFLSGTDEAYLQALAQGYVGAGGEHLQLCGASLSPGPGGLRGGGSRGGAPLAGTGARNARGDAGNLWASQFEGHDVDGRN